MSEIKVYQMNEYEWIAAANESDALLEHAKRMGYENIEDLKADYPEDIPRELSEKEMLEHTYVEDIENQEDEDDAISFRDALDEMIERGDSFPCHFATSSELL